MKKFIVAFVLGFCLLVPGSASARADILCTDDLIIGLPVEVCVNVPGVGTPVLPNEPVTPAPPVTVPVIPEEPATPVQPAPPAVAPQEPAPSTESPAIEPEDVGTPVVRPAPEDEAQSDLEEHLFPFVVGGTLLLLAFFVSKLVGDFKNSRAKTVDRNE